MVREADDGFEVSEAVPAELLLKRGELIDPSGVEPVPVTAGGEAAKLAGQLALEDWYARILDHGRKDSAEAVVRPDEMAQQRTSLLGNAVEKAFV